MNDNKTFEINTLYMTKPQESIPVLILRPENEKVHGNLHIQFVKVSKGEHKLDFSITNMQGRKIMPENSSLYVNLQKNGINIDELVEKNNSTLFGEIALDFWADIPKGEKDFINIKVTIDDKYTENLFIFIGNGD